VINSPDEVALSVDGWVTSDALAARPGATPSTTSLVSSGTAQVAAGRVSYEACDVELIADSSLGGAHVLRVSAAATAGKTAVAEGRVFAQFPDPALGQRLDVPLPLLVIHADAGGQFFALEADVMTTAGPKTVTLSNRQSVVRIRPGAVSAPLSLDAGWSVAVADLGYIVSQAFIQTTARAGAVAAPGTGAPGPARYIHCERVRVHPDCRLAALYFARAVEPFAALPVAVRRQSAALAAAAV
jgi:hypothetical protein